MAQDDLLRRLPNIPDKDWPFPFPRSDWDRVPPSVRAFPRSLLSRVETLETKLSESSQNSGRPLLLRPSLPKAALEEEGRAPELSWLAST